MAKRSDRTLPPATAWIVINGRADRECSLLDVSPVSAKVVVQDDSRIPDRFELAFFQSVDKRLDPIGSRAPQILGHEQPLQRNGVRPVGALGVQRRGKGGGECDAHIRTLHDGSGQRAMIEDTPRSQLLLVRLDKPEPLIDAA